MTFKNLIKEMKADPGDCGSGHMQFSGIFKKVSDPR